jgi:hypothetical protein
MGNSSFWITVTEFISLPPFLFVLAEILHGWYVIVIILVAAAQMTEHPKLSVTNLNESIVLPLMISGTTLAFVESIRVLTPFTEWSQKRYGWITGFPVRPYLHHCCSSQGPTVGSHVAVPCSSCERTCIHHRDPSRGGRCMEDDKNWIPACAGMTEGARE